MLLIASRSQASRRCCSRRQARRAPSSGDISPESPLNLPSISRHSSLILPRQVTAPRYLHRSPLSVAPSPSQPPINLPSISLNLPSISPQSPVLSGERSVAPGARLFHFRQEAADALQGPMTAADALRASSGGEACGVTDERLYRVMKQVMANQIRLQPNSPLTCHLLQASLPLILPPLCPRSLAPAHGRITLSSLLQLGLPRQVQHTALDGLSGEMRPRFPKIPQDSPQIPYPRRPLRRDAPDIP